MNVITTERLILRTWRPEDIEPYWQINQDPVVMEYLLGPASRESVENFFVRAQTEFDRYRFCRFAAEEKKSGALIGFVGLSHVSFDAHFVPAVDIGWRLGAQYWGKGYATEAARAVIQYGFDVIALPEIVAFTVAPNLRSQRVMQKLGMERDVAGDFMHPRVPKDHELALHWLYRLKR